jgi:hypothetical protein
MAGSAILDPNQLLDGLVGDVDELRDLAREFGIRPYRLLTVIRTWDGTEIGDGDYVDVMVEITPRPKVEPFTSLQNKLLPCGLAEAGTIRISEVSLSYTYPELTGDGLTLAAGQEFKLAVAEGEGQLQPTRFFVHDRPPFSDREKTQGWLIWLRLQQGA